MGTISLQCKYQTLIVPVAMPGSGKTTLLNQIKWPGFRHGPDDVRRAIYGKVEEQGNGQKVHEAARACLECRLAMGLPAAYDATNITAKQRKVITDLGRKYNYHTLALISKVPQSIARLRNVVRTEGVVPGHVIDRMAQQAQSSPVTLEEDFDSLVWFDEDDEYLVIEWL